MKNNDSLDCEPFW